jgi:transcriptional regulator with XRE-family HTH domain
VNTSEREQHTMGFGEQLRSWRCRRRATQQALGERLGVPSMAVQRWELGHSLPPPAHQSALVEALGVSPDEFFAALEGDRQEWAGNSRRLNEQASG